MAKRVLARPHHGHAPAGPRPRHEPADERRDEARSNQGGLAAAGRTDHREKAGGSQAAEQLVDLALASEEEMILVGFERPKPGKRVLYHRSRATNAASGAASPTFHPGRTVPSCVRKRSFSGVLGSLRRIASAGGGSVRP